MKIKLYTKNYYQYKSIFGYLYKAQIIFTKKSNERSSILTNILLLKAHPQFSNEDEILLKEPVKRRDKTVKIIEPSDH